MTKQFPEILIVSTKADIATDYVILSLKKQDANFYRLNTEDFPLNSFSSISFEPSSKLARWEWKEDELHYDFNNVKSVWYRRHRLPEMPPEISEAHAEYCLRESDWFLKGILWELESNNQKVRWMSKPSILRICDSKIFQLQLAQNIGFKIPQTLISTDPEEVRKFFIEHQGDVIAKPLRLGYFDYGELQTSVYTSRLNWEDLQNDDEIRIAPVIYQKHLKKKYDIRVTVVEDKVFSAAIDSQKIPSAIIDWRKTETENIIHLNHQLPKNIEAKCIAFLKNLGLSYGAIDFVLTPENDYFFWKSIQTDNGFGWKTDLVFLFPKKLLIGSINQIKNVMNTDLYNSLRDIIWARIENLQAAQESQSHPIQISNNETALYVQSLLKEEIKTEDDRSKIIDGKLQGLLSLISIGMAILSIVVGFLIKDFDVKKIDGVQFWITIVELLFTFYIALQILRALVSIIKGLRTHHYQSFKESDLIPLKNERRQVFQQRITSDMMTILKENKIVNNLKADELNLAHVAIRNCVWAVFLMILLIISLISSQLFFL